MKKYLSLILSILLVISFAFFAVGSSSSDDEDATQKAGKADSDTVEENQLGNYSLEIKSARTTENWEGKPSIVITYSFTNNSDDSTSFYIAFQDNAYQDGIGLERAYTMKDGDPYDEANQSKDIKPGASIDVDVGYILNDTETDVEVEVEELFSFDEKTISKTFSIK